MLASEGRMAGGMQGLAEGGNRGREKCFFW